MTPLALLFDLDGTLLDSDPLHHRAFEVLLEDTDRVLGFDEYRREIIGKSNTEIMAYLFPDRPDEHADLADRKEQCFRDSLGSDTAPIRGIEALLDWVRAQNGAAAVVTNAPRANAEAVLAATGLAGRFDAVVVGDECDRPKPDPEPYREAMRLLGATPSRAMAFEDSPSGLCAARGSGAQVFGLTTSLGPEALRQAGAHQIIADFTDPALWAHLQSLRTRAA
jgi:HAD superfamily hydrolase (TIGR01509 family)